MEHDIKGIARRTYEQIFPACDVDALAEVVDAAVISHPGRPGEQAGFAGVRDSMLWLGRVFSDQRWQIHHAIAEGDIVVLHATHHGRQTGELMGIPATGRTVAYDYVHIIRFRDGKGVEHWGVRDDMTLMRQLGVLPERPPASSPR